MRGNMKYKLAKLYCLVIGVVTCSNAWGAPAGSSPVGEETMFDLLWKGGPVMIPLGLGSVLAVAIMIERFISLKKERDVPEDLIDKLLTARKEDNTGVKAIAYCEEIGGAVGKIFKAGLQRLHKGEDAVEKAIEDAGYREADKLKRSLRGLSIIATVSPLLGLLGTVYGMIEAFQTASSIGMGKSDVLAKGIYEALVTTATGLTIAIPVLLVYQYLSGKVDAIVDDLDEMGMDFMLSCVDEVEAAGN